MKIKLYIVLLAVSAFGLSNCKKQLDLKPTDVINANNAFITIADIAQGVNGAYRRYGAYANDMFVSSLASDEGKLGSGFNGVGSFTFRWQYQPDPTTGRDVIAAFGSYYALIDQCNRVLEKVPTVSASAAEEPLRGKYRGELLGLRALGHFGLLRNYSGIYNASDPLGVPVMTLSEPLGYPARNSMGEVMTLIENDLNEAKALLAGQPFSDTVLNTVNIAAFQARVALYKKDYESAITYATEVINSGAAPISSGPGFLGIWVDINRNELLFRIMYNGSSIGAMFTSTGGNIAISPADKLVSTYSSNDIRLQAYIGTHTSGEKYVNKFYQSSRGGRIVDMKAARIAEMYLIRAEAYARKASPDLTAGAADLNLLRSNRISGYTPPTFPTAQELIDAVMLERYKELAFEGFRFYDLKRNNLPVERLASESSPEWRTLPAGNFRFIMPIPSEEIDANPQMQQNPGY